MQKTTTLKDFKVQVLKTILAIFVLSISFGSSFGQDVRSKKFGNIPKTAQDAKQVVVQKSTAPLTEAQGVALKQQMTKASGSNLSGARTASSNKAVMISNKAVTSAQKQSDNPAFISSPNVMASPNKTTVACLFNGTLAAGDLTMPGRLTRPGTAGGTCATPQPYPGTTVAGPYFYDTYTFTNTTGAAACVTATLTTTDLVNANIQAGAWLGTFVPANLGTNYIADPYVSTGTPAAPAGLTFSFNLANGATVVFVVWSANPNTTPAGTASQYTLSVDGLPNLCPQPACVPPTASVISAVSIPYNEGFDGVIPTAGWPIQNNSNPVGPITWNQGNANGVFPAHSGAGYASANFNSVNTLGTISNWMFAPATTLHNGDKFTFWTSAAAGGGIFPDRLQVRMSQNGASTNVGASETSVGDFTSLLLDINPTYSTTAYPETWTQFTATVSGVPAGGIQGRIAFRYFVENAGLLGANSNYIGIDDAQYLAAGTPQVCAGGTAYLKVDITGGSSPFKVVIQPTPPGTVGSQITVNGYQSGQLIQVNPTVPTDYTIVSVTAAGSGANCLGTGNSGVGHVNISPAPTASVLSQVQIAGPPTNLINEDFVIAPPATWFTQNNSAPGGLISWFQGNTAVFPANSGAPTSYLAVNFNSTGGANTISNWALTPTIAMKNGDKFSFFTRTTTGAFPDRLQLRFDPTGSTNVGTSPTDVGNYTNLLLDINPTYTTTGYPTAWTQFTVTVSGLPAAGIPSGRFAFRYFVENGGPAGANSDYIGIDNVVYTAFPLINPTTCTGSTANLKVDITGGTSPFTVVIGATPAQAGFPKTVSNYISGANIPVTPPVTTTYNLISVQDATGCFGTGNTGTPTITVSPTTIGPLQIIDQPTGPLCAGDPKLLTVVGAPSVQCFSNAGVILIPGVGTGPGPAAPYPATINVTGLPTSGVTVKNVTLTNMNHTWTSDVDIVLQNPAGTQNVILLSDFGGSNDLSNTTITFDDLAAAQVTNANPIPSGTFKPTNVGTPDDWPAPGPTGVNQANPTLSTFTGDMNGLWKLYIADQAGGDAGNVNGGYQICFSVPSAPPAGYTWLWTPAAGLSSTTTNPVAASPMSTTTYTVMGTAPSGCQTTAAITITVLPLPAVTQNPTSVTACAGTSVSFTGAGSGAGITYQWQYSTTGAGGPWINVPTGAPYSGETTTTLTINPVPFSFNGYRYRLSVNGTCPPAATSSSALLTVIAQPNVTVSPNGTVCGGVAGISGLALTASGANTYTWAPATGLYTNTGATTAYVAGANANPVYAAPTVYTVYTVTGTNTATGCTNTATVIVNATPPPPVITPNPVSMCLGDLPVRLINASNAPGACTVNSGTISVPVPDGTATGAISTLAVNCVPVGATVTGISVTFTMPDHTYVADMSLNLKAPNGTVLNLFRNLGATGGTNTTYPNTGFASVKVTSAGGATFASQNTPAVGTLTGTFSADMLNAISAPFYTLGDPTGYTSTATAWNQLYSQPNGTWTLAMADDGAGDVGTLTNWSITINYTPGIPTAAAVWSPNFPGPNNYLWLDQAKTQPYIAGTAHDTVYTQPVPAGVYTYNVTVQGLPTPPVTVTTPMAAGNANSMIFFNVTNNNAAPYTLNSVATNTDASGACQGRIWYKLGAITGNPGTINAASGWTATPLINLNAVAGSLNTVANAIGLSINSTQTYGIGVEIVSGATIFCAYTNGTGTLVNYTNNGITLTTDGNVGWGGPNAPGPAANNPRNFNGSISLSSSIPACTSPARVVTVTVNNPIAITTQPVNHAVCTNGTTSFTVAATGTGVTYQWQVSSDAGNTWTNITNNANYSGATTATLTITNPPTSWNGFLYRAMVNGAVPCPSVPSNNVVLTVNPLPTITLAASPYRNLLPGLQTAIFATSSPTAATYTWFRNGIAVPGGTVNPLPVNVDGIGTYSVRITDVNGCTNTSGTIVIGDSTSGRVWIYPNPTGGRFGVRYNPTHNNVTPRGVNIYDALGKRILTQKYTLGIPFAPMNVDLSNYSTGVYWVEVVDVDGNRLAVGRVEIIR